MKLGVKYLYPLSHSTCPLWGLLEWVSGWLALSEQLNGSLVFSFLSWFLHVQSDGWKKVMCEPFAPTAVSVSCVRMWGREGGETLPDGSTGPELVLLLFPFFSGPADFTALPNGAVQSGTPSESPNCFYTSILLPLKMLKASSEIPSGSSKMYTMLFLYVLAYHKIHL